MRKLVEFYVTMMMYVDVGCDRVLRPITKLWCHATGRSNKTFANLVLILAGALLVTNSIIAIEDKWDVLWAIFAIAVWSWVVFIRIQMHGLAYNAMQANNDTIPIEMAQQIIIRGAVLLPFSTFFLPGLFQWESFLGSLGWMLYLWSWYICWHFNVGGKSWLKRGIEKTTELAEKAKALLPAPMPQPIPLGNT